MKKDNQAFVTVLQEWSAIFARKTIHDFMLFAHEHGLSMAQISILMRLYYQGAATIADLRKDLYGSRAAASQMIDRLVEESLVERAEAEDDRRLKVITLTEQGKALVELGIATRRRWLQDLADTFDGQQKEEFSKMLSAMIQSARGLEKPQRGENSQE